MPTHATGYALANKGVDTRILQSYLGHHSHSVYSIAPRAVSALPRAAEVVEYNRIDEHPVCREVLRPAGQEMLHFVTTEFFGETSSQSGTQLYLTLWPCLLQSVRVAARRSQAPTPKQATRNLRASVYLRVSAVLPV